MKELSEREDERLDKEVALLVKSTFLEYFANHNAYTRQLGKLVNWQILIGQLWCET